MSKPACLDCGGSGKCDLGCEECNGVCPACGGSGKDSGWLDECSSDFRAKGWKE